MERDNPERRDLDMLCAESAMQLDTLDELCVTAHELQAKARAAQDTAQLARETSRRLLRRLAGH